MKKLLVICGPTAVGKTKLGLRLAKKFRGELISADSRQVYRGMDIGTGKDLSKNSKFQNSKTPDIGGFYLVDGIKIWGYDLVDPKKEFSVAQYVKIAREIIKSIWRRKKLAVLVGGTGLYIKGVVDGIETAKIPPNIVLRKSLENKKVSELFEILATFDPVKAASLNYSDRNNPRRLIRAIEIANSKLPPSPRLRRASKTKNIEEEKLLADDALFIGLVLPSKVLNVRIDKRVDTRMRQGFENEVCTLLETGVSWSAQSMTSLGYRQWKDYVEGVAKKDKVVEKWKQEERKYAKRQVTWFKKDKRIKWFNVAKKNWEKDVEKLAKEWYISSNIKL